MSNRITLASSIKPLLEGRGGPIVAPTDETLEIKPHYIKMLKSECQFHGLSIENPNAHLNKFINLSDSFTQIGTNRDLLRLHLFPYSLSSRALTWFYEFEPNSIHTWEEMATKFLAKYFPPSLQTKLKNDVTNFHQEVNESLSTAWERYKKLIGRCQKHQLDETNLVCTFYNSLNPQHKQTLDAASSGNFMLHTSDEAWKLIETIAMHQHNLESDESTSEERSTSNQTLDKLRSQLDSINQIVKDLQESSNPKLKKVPQKFFPSRRANEEILATSGNPNHALHSKPFIQRFTTQPTSRSLVLSTPSPLTSRLNNETFKNFIVEQNNVNRKIVDFQNQIDYLTRISNDLIKNMEDNVSKLFLKVEEKQREEAIYNSVNHSSYDYDDILVVTRGGKETKNEKSLDIPTTEPSTSLPTDSVQVDTPVTSPEPEPSKAPEVIKPTRIPFPGRLKKEKQEAQFGKYLEMFKSLH